VNRSVARLRRYLMLVVLAVGVMGGTTGCVTTGTNPVSGNERVYGYSWEEEQELGAKADKQIRAQYGLYENDEMQQYVDRVGQRVLAESDLRRPDTPARFKNTEFEFTILDSPVVNAFALPGGYVYITRGLMSHLNNEAQLAVVLGHEITHVAARHSSAQAGKAQLGQLGLLLGGLGAQAAGLPGGRIMQIGQQAAQLLFLEYSRDNEEESDARGVEYAARAGYKASEGSEFFRTLERIQEKRGQALPTWQSTHPDPGNRRRRIPELAREFNEGPRVAQEAYLDQIEGMIAGENPRNGYTDGGTFYHPDLAFQFPVPRGFSVNNTPRAVQMMEENQRAQMVFTFAEGSSPRQAAQQMAQQYRQQRGVRLLEDGSTQSSGNLPAYFLLVEGQTQQGQTIRILSYFVEYDGQVYVFQAAAPGQLFSRYEDVFLNTMRGFGPVRDRSRLNVEPTHLYVERANQSAPFRQFAGDGSRIDGIDEQDLAIINQVELNERIERGRLLKLLR
jgi:predicted Zn-dependent protease